MVPNIARMVAKNPKQATIPMHFAQSFGSRDLGDKSPDYIRDSQMSFPLSPQSREKVANLVETISGQRPQAGLGISAVVKDPTLDVMGQMTTLATNPKEYLGQLSPVLRPISDALTGTYSGTDIPREWSWRPFHEGSTGIGAIEAGPGEGGWLSDYGEQFLGWPITQGVNLWNTDKGREALFGKPIGGRDAETAQKLGLRGVNTLTGMGLHYTDPTSELMGLGYDKDVQKAAKTMNRYKKLKKEAREKDSWNKKK